MTSDSVVDERTLRELYLTNFEIAVKEGHPKSIMSSYNKVNGTYANENSPPAHRVLRDEWGFDGFVVTDWGGCNSQTARHQSGQQPGDARHHRRQRRELMASLKEGKITEGEIDLRVDQLLDVILATHEATAGGKRDFDQEAHHAVARQAAAQTAVLLKNENDLLPLAPNTRVAVIGDMALEPPVSGLPVPLWSIPPSGQTSGLPEGQRSGRSGPRPGLPAQRQG